jgi:hypothetical protein
MVFSLSLSFPLMAKSKSATSLNKGTVCLLFHDVPKNIELKVTHLVNISQKKYGSK